MTTKIAAGTKAIVLITEGPYYNDPNHFVEFFPSDDYTDEKSGEWLVVPQEHVFNGKAELEFTTYGEAVVKFLSTTPSFTYWSFSSNSPTGVISTDEFYHAFAFEDITEAEKFHKEFGGRIIN